MELGTREANVRMKENALFISHWKYLDHSIEEGGVRVCTMEYINLIETQFDVFQFGVEYNYSLKYRIKSKLGINAYDDYKPTNYLQKIKDVIDANKITYVFLNLSNTAVFAECLKSAFGSKIKVILCSHGNESGDYLHEVTRFKARMPFVKRLFAPFVLGNMLIKEAGFRQPHIDLVLTVSEVEHEIENWLGAKKVMLVPRTISPMFLEWKPIQGRVGFIGNLSHWPNLHGIEEICVALSKLKTGIQIRLVGSPSEVGEGLASRYTFVCYLGFLETDQLLKEAASWSLFINPVFYYSRGVSTKLAKALSWGLPVVTTDIGCRGYQWKESQCIVVDSADNMAMVLHQLCTDELILLKAKSESETIANTSITLLEIGDRLHLMLKKI